MLQLRQEGTSLVALPQRRRDDDDKSQATKREEAHQGHEQHEEGFHAASKDEGGRLRYLRFRPSEEESHFQFADGGFQFTQVENEFEPQIAKLFKQTHGTKIKLDLREIILLDSQSTMDLICNPALVKKTFRVEQEHAPEEQWWDHDGDPQGKDGRLPYARVVQHESHHQYPCFEQRD